MFVFRLAEEEKLMEQSARVRQARDVVPPLPLPALHNLPPARASPLARDA